MPRFVVLDGFTLNPGDNPWLALEALGELSIYDRSADDEIVARALGAEILLTNKTPLGAASLTELPALRGICVLATGVDGVDVAFAHQRGVVVCNVPAYSTASTAQHTIALLLELANRVGLHDRAVHEGQWVAAPDFSLSMAPLCELSGLMLGVVGFGAIGRRVAEIARALGMRICAVGESRRPTDPPWLERVPLERLLRESDVVSLHCPLTPETQALLNAERLRWMQRHAWLINAGRGALIDEPALAEALERGVIAGAALDVLGSEPPSADSPLLFAKNCVITPHVAWTTLAARRRAMQITVDNVRGILEGKPQNVVPASAQGAALSVPL